MGYKKVSEILGKSVKVLLSENTHIYVGGTLTDFKAIHLDDDFLQQLERITPGRVSLSTDVRNQHGKDMSYHDGAPPDAVVYAHSTDEVSKVVTLCAKSCVPVIPFGAGTSLEGHVAALHGGVSLDLTGMNQILAVHDEDLNITVEAGVTRKQVNQYLRDMGLFFPIDPGADATIGGMTATRASGTNAVRYGTMRENVMALTVVLADGQVIKTGTRAKKSSAGYDLTHLFVGSEGTLGVVTEITLRLYGIPEATVAAVCSYATLEGAVNTVISTIQMGIPVARIELVDDVQMDAINKYSKLDYPVQPTLFFEFHGTENGVQEQSELVNEISQEQGGSDFVWARKAEDRSRLWQARHDAYLAALAMRPGYQGVVSDVCVPISRLAGCILETRKDIDATGLYAPIVGHVGDGNFHLATMINPNDSQQLDKAKQLNARLVARALEMEGTCTGEHGVGYGKLDYMETEHGAAIGVMRTLKKSLDPENIMNPGKIIRL